MNPMRSIRRCLLAAAWVVTALACTDPVDKAAKKRIFSPEDPPQVIASAGEKLSADRIAEDPKVARRVLDMSAAETTERLGPHKFMASVNFEWAGNQNRTVKLVENRTLIAGSGGVNGDFHAVMENSHDQGLEVLRVGGEVYAKNRFGKFRQRKRDRGMSERKREEVFGALRELDGLFRGRLSLEAQGTSTYEGRTTWKYGAGLAKADKAAAVATPGLPALAQAKGGRDDTTARRLTFFDKREPRTLQGEILVDEQTGVVLKARLDGRITAPDEGGGEVNLRLVLDSKVTDIGKEPSLRTPKDFLPDEDKPQGIADALDRFGVPRAGQGQDAGTETEQTDDEPTQ